MTIIQQETFLKLSAREVAELVRAAGPQVCVFPINGTRRWFMLEHAETLSDDPIQAYLNIAIKRQLELCGMMFDHGVDTLLTPVFGAELLTRGDEYTKRVGIDGLLQIVSDPASLEFFEKYSVRVRFYGDYRKYLEKTPFAYALDAIAKTIELTKNNTQARMFFGIFADDATETIAELAINHFQKTGTKPSRRELVEQYYGEYVEAASLFIGFGKFNTFDYPLLNLGTEDLYFSFSPSPYMTPAQLCEIIYDHIYSRKIEEQDYTKMSEQDFARMRNFYQANRERTMGIGEFRNGIWYPLAR